MAEQHEKALVPQIRFAGFTDPWEQRKLGEVATFGGGHTPSMSDSDNYEGGNVLWVTSQDVKSHYLDGTTTQITEKGAKELTLYPAGSLVMVTRSGILRHTLPVAELRKPSTVNQDIRVILPQENYYGQWLLQFFISRNKELLLEFGKTGTTVESVDFSKMRDMVLLTPSLPEQQQIGRYFARLDNLITLHQRKYNKLLNVKKSMLEKMFPKNGSNIPEIRFKGFTDPWEQRKLGDVVPITMGQSPDGSTYSDTPSDYILVQGNADLQNGWVTPRIWTSQVTKKADAGDLIMSVRAPAGAMGKTAYNVVIGRGVAAIKGNEFIYQLLVKMNSNGYWKVLSCGSTFESLNSDNIKNADVLIPDVAEQEKIGEYFVNLDRLITLHQRELEKLQNIKKSMLEKMFV